MPLDLSPALSEVLIFAAGLALLLLGAFRDEEPARLLAPLAALALAVAALVVLGQDKARVVGLGGHFVFDGYAAFLKVVILAGSAVSIMMAGGFMRDQRIDRFEYPILALFSALGMCMMVSANSLLALYMSIELQSLPLYVLAAFNRDSLRSTEAGLKYFVLSTLSSCFLLYGCSLIYGFTGTIFFDRIGEVLAATAGEGTAAGGVSLGVLVGLVFVIAGLAFKLAAVPFHMWTPDVYEGAPSPITAFIGSAPKLAAFGLAVRFLMEPFGAWGSQWQQVIVAISIGSMVLGAFGAIGQTSIKRLMAYSGIGNIGFALIGLAAGTAGGVNAVLVYMTLYVVMVLGTFGCILLMRRQGRYVETIADLAGISRRRPLLALAFAVFMFSLAGIPPLAGFFSKLYVFKAAVDADLAWLAVVGVVASVVGAYYYLRVIKVMYFDEPGEALDPAPYAAPAAVAGVAAVAMVAFVVLPGPLLTTAQAAAEALLR
jgi:NADH-quinone oxidoreductase subunit N